MYFWGYFCVRSERYRASTGINIAKRIQSNSENGRNGGNINNRKHAFPFIVDHFADIFVFFGGGGVKDKTTNEKQTEHQRETNNN